MEYDPASYEENCHDIYQPAMALIKQIKANNMGNKQLEVVVDIGSGPGNTVKILKQELNPKRIIGIDISPEMINYAKVNNQFENSEYYRQDYTSDWSEWDPSLQNLSGKVSVIFSNYSLIFLLPLGQNIINAAKNFFNLLSNSGVIVVNVLTLGNVYRVASLEERQKLDELLNFPHEVDVLGHWVSAFKSAGLTQIDVKYWEPKAIFPEKSFTEDFVDITIGWFKACLKTGITVDSEFDEFIRDLVIRAQMSKMSEKSSDGGDQVEVKHEMWNFVVRK